MEQGSVPWHEWRSKGLGSSDAPIIMGLTKFSTPLELWKKKLSANQGFAEQSTNDWAQRRGHEYEPKIRALYELDTGLEFAPVAIESPDLSYVRASLDGRSEEAKAILEIKMPGAEIIRQAKAGIVDEYYTWQLEHQLLADPTSDCVHFVVGELSDKKALSYSAVIYKSDPIKREALKLKLAEFWNSVQTKKAPPLTSEDALERTDQQSVEIYKKIKALKSEIISNQEKNKPLEAELKKLRDLAIKNMTHSFETCQGVNLKRSSQRSVDYERMSAEGMDLAPFTTVSVRYTLTMSGEDKA